MLGRLVCALGASLAFVAACSGGQFGSAEDGAGSSGKGGEASSGGKTQGGSSSKAGGSSKSGASAGGSSTVAGMSNGGINSGGGVVGVSGSGGGMQGEAGAPVSTLECMEPSDCATSNSCHEPTCEAGLCDELDVPDGPFRLQVAGDCKRMDCVAGEETLALDLADKDDGNECTTDSCGPNGVPMHKARFAEVCANSAGTCNGEGKCEQCNRNACPAATQCNVPICSNGSCILAPRPAGDPCSQVSSQDPNDTSGQCDGAGSCVDCVNSGGCGECCVCSNKTCVDA